MLRNCQECNGIYSHPVSRLCAKCSKKRNDEFIKVRDYVRKNPNSVINDVVLATEVSYEHVREFVEEDRLKLVPADMTKHCALCNVEITQGRICNDCAGVLNKKANKASAHRTQTGKVDNQGVHIRKRILSDKD